MTPPVPGGHPASHAKPWHQLLQQREGGGRQDGDGRGEQDGGHRALLGGAAGRHEAAVGGLRGPGVLLQEQRISAQRLGKIVSSTALCPLLYFVLRCSLFSLFYIFLFLI